MKQVYGVFNLILLVLTVVICWNIFPLIWKASLADPQDVSGDETSKSSHSRIIYRSSRAPAPIGPYNQAVRVDDVLYISGQIGLSPETGEMPDSVEDQTFQTLNNMAQILEVRLRINVLQHNS